MEKIDLIVENVEPGIEEEKQPLVKRGRGRPRKPIVEPVEPPKVKRFRSCFKKAVDEDTEPIIKRPRGRPRKPSAEKYKTPKAFKVLLKRGRKPLPKPDIPPVPVVILPPDYKGIRPVGRPRLENPTLSGKPKDPDYFKNYYHRKTKFNLVSCPNCSEQVCINALNLHQKSKKCGMMQTIKQLSSEALQ